MLGHLALEPCPKRHLRIGADLTAPSGLQAPGSAVAVDIRAPRPVQEGRMPGPEGENEAVRVGITPPRIARVIFRLHGVGKRISGLVHRGRSEGLWGSEGPRSAGPRHPAR